MEGRRGDRGDSKSLSVEMRDLSFSVGAFYC